MDDQDNEVAIFWDYENCPAPAGYSGFQLVRRIRDLVQPHGPIKMFKAYLSIAEQSQLSKSTVLRSELQASGVSLTDTPHNSRKDVADKMMIVDMLTHAMDNPAPATIVVISGDRDFAYAISILRLRRYEVVLVTLSNAHQSLVCQASVCYEWALDVLGTQEIHSSPAPLNVGKNGEVFRFPSLRGLGTSAGLLSNPSTPSRGPRVMLSRTSPRKQTGKATPFQTSMANLEPRTYSRLEGPTFFSTPLPSLSSARPSNDEQSGSPVSPTVDLFNGYLTRRVSERTAVDDSDPFVVASRYYPSPKLSSSRLDSPERRAEPQDHLRNGPSHSTPNIAYTAPNRDDEATMTLGPTSGLALTTARGHAQHPSITPSDWSCASSSYASAPEESAEPEAQVLDASSIPPHFYSLITLLRSYHESGKPRVFRPSIALEILTRNSAIYDGIPGVRNFADYAKLASAKGLVEMGGDGGDGWIALRPEYLNLQLPDAA